MRSTRKLRYVVLTVLLLKSTLTEALAETNRDIETSIRRSGPFSTPPPNLIDYLPNPFVTCFEPSDQNIKKICREMYAIFRDKLFTKQLRIKRGDVLFNYDSRRERTLSNSRKCGRRAWIARTQFFAVINEPLVIPMVPRVVNEPVTIASKLRVRLHAKLDIPWKLQRKVIKCFTLDSGKAFASGVIDTIANVFTTVSLHPKITETADTYKVFIRQRTHVAYKLENMEVPLKLAENDWFASIWKSSQATIQAELKRSNVLSRSKGIDDIINSFTPPLQTKSGVSYEIPFNRLNKNAKRNIRRILRQPYRTFQAANGRNNIRRDLEYQFNNQMLQLFDESGVIELNIPKILLELS